MLISVTMSQMRLNFTPHKLQLFPTNSRLLYHTFRQTVIKISEFTKIGGEVDRFSGGMT